MLASFHVLPLVAGTIRPCLQTVAMLLVLLPLAGVLRSVEMAIDAKPVSFVVLPGAIIYVAVSVDQSAFAVGFVELDKNDQNITRNHIQPSKTT